MGAVALGGVVPLTNESRASPESPAEALGAYEVGVAPERGIIDAACWICAGVSILLNITLCLQELINIVG